MTGIYVNPEKQICEKRTIEANLQSYYDLLEIDCIDIVTRKIHGKYYDIICDDEAPLKDNPKISMIDENCKPMLYGNLFVVKAGEAGQLASLKKHDIKCVLGSWKTLLTNKGLMNFMIGGY